MLICLLGAAAVGSVAAEAAKTATVLVADLNVRAGPGRRHAVVGRLPKAARITIVARENGWLKIAFKRLNGYVIDQADFVRIDGSGDTAAAEPTTPATRAADAQSADFQSRLKTSQAELAVTQRREGEIIAALQAAEEELNLARRKVRETEAAIADLRTAMEGLEQQTAALAQSINTREAYAAERLVALYKLNWMGRIQLLATADSFFDVICRQAALGRILAQDEALLDNLYNQQHRLEALLTQLNARQAEKRALELSLNERISALGAERERRSVLLTTVRSRKSLLELALLELQKAGRELESTVKSMPLVAPPICEKETAGSFNAYKGLLSWPVRGKILTFFGSARDEKYNVTQFASGINIKAERGEPIRAVGDGYTVFASWFKGFGNMVIIDHGDRYYTVYAHLEEVFKVKGDRVEKGEVIATLGDSGSLIGPALHFEIRHHGKPMDPLQWIKKG